MMDYKQMAEIVTKEVDAILERKKRRAIIVKRVSLSASGICAAGIVGIGIWHNDKIKNAIHHDDPSVITEISENTTTEKTALTTVNTTETTDIVKTTSVNNTTTKTSSAKAETSEVKTDSINTSTLAKTSNSNSAVAVTSSNNIIQNTTLTTSTVNEEKTQTANPVEITDIHTSTATTAESTTQTTSVGLCEIFNNFVFTYSNGDASASNKPESREMQYINDIVDKEELSGSFIKKSLQKQYFNGEKLVDIETYAEFYSIKDYSINVMLAVRFDDSDKYYRYINKAYHPYSIGDIIYDFSLTADDLSDEIYLNEQLLTDCDTEKTWELLTANLFLQNKTSYCQNNGIVPDNTLLLRFESTSKTWLKGSIGVDLRGYIWITINDILNNSFYIGEERANEIFEYYN